MKHFTLLAFAIAAFSSTSWAQRGSGKMTSTPVSQPPKSSSGYSGEKTLKLSAGMTKSALHFGAQYEMAQTAGSSFGGYLFNQSEKESASVPSVLALGGQFCFHLLDSGANKIYLSPGFGLFKSKFDGEEETALGPSLRVGVNWSLQNGASLGLERFEVFNWTSSDALESAAAVSAVYSFNF